MAKLIYSALTPLDGYVADEDGNFDCTPQRITPPTSRRWTRYNAPRERARWGHGTIRR
jgi:hypothetical protein